VVHGKHAVASTALAGAAAVERSLGDVGRSNVSNANTSRTSDVDRISMSVATELITVARPLVGFTPIPIGILRHVESFGFDLYQDEGGTSPSFLWGKDYTINSSELAVLLKRGASYLYIRNEDRTAENEQFWTTIQTLLCSPAEPIERFQLLHEVSTSCLDAVFQKVQTDSIVAATMTIARQLAQLLENERVSTREIWDIVRYSTETFAHVMNVATYSVLIAKRRNVSGQELAQVAIGGLLHDIGKRHIARRAMANPADLTPAERDVLYAHPQAGYEELCNRPDMHFGALMMVYQHHERPDGEGYPVAVTTEDTHLWARICSVADTFDNLTGKRPHRRLIDLPTALEQLEHIAGGNRLDWEIVRCWREILSKS
jgi:hypothetical protein